MHLLTRPSQHPPSNALATIQASFVHLLTDFKVLVKYFLIKMKPLAPLACNVPACAVSDVWLHLLWASWLIM